MNALNTLDSFLENQANSSSQFDEDEEDEEDENINEELY